MEEKEAVVGGIRTSFKVAGQGPGVLILHGWRSSSDSWVDVQEKIASHGYYVVCPDLPGFGKSQIPPDAWGVSDYAKWVAEFVDFEKLNNFHIISHSFGGRITIKFSVKHPELIKSIVFCAVAGLKHKPDLKTQTIFLMAKIGNIIFAPNIMRKVRDTARNIFYFFFRNRDYVKTSKNMRETMKKVLEEDLFPYLSGIKPKSLVIWGKRDKVLPIEDALIFHQEIKDSKLEILPSVGHSPHLQVPDSLSEVILDFIKNENDS